MNYARRNGQVVDIIRERTNSLWVQTKGGRQVRWLYSKSPIEIIEFGSLNPKNENYVPGGKVLRTIKGT